LVGANAEREKEHELTVESFGWMEPINALPSRMSRRRMHGLKLSVSKFFQILLFTMWSEEIRLGRARELWEFFFRCAGP
jgi:hypothetical protein